MSNSAALKRGTSPATVRPPADPRAGHRRDVASIPAWLMAELRSDHAGETGAVSIYRGILAVSQDPWVRDMAASHLITERRHLAVMDRLVPPASRSRLLPLWRVAGWLTGALPALFGPRAVYITIEAVESFVDDHYGAQLRALDAMPQHSAIYARLVECWEDEVEHRDEAAALAGRRRSLIARLWGAMVGGGSRFAVALARRM